MSGCLGLYLGEKIIKYAKVEIDSQNRVDIKKTGVRFVARDKFETVRSMLQEVNQEEYPVSINLLTETYDNLKLINKLSKSDLAKVINIEYEDICEKKGLNPNYFEKKYVVSNNENAEDETLNVLMVREKKETLDLIKKSLPGVEIGGLIPQRATIKNLVQPSEQNYILLNFEEQTQVITVLKGEVVKSSFITMGVANVLEALAQNLNSYEKAYEICKAMNVYGENTGNIPVECERLAEPIIQEMIHRVETNILESKKDINKIYITGTGTMFTNLDLLFKEYFGIETVLLKPWFIDLKAHENNLSEILEVNSAISLAYEVLLPTSKSLNFATGEKMKGKLFGFLGGKGKEKSNSKEKIAEVNMTEEEKELALTRANLQTDIEKNKANKKVKIGSPNLEKVSSIVTNLDIVVGCALVTYIAIGLFFDMQIVSSKKEFVDKSREIGQLTQTIQSDLDYVNGQKKQYEEVNKYIDETLEKINNKEIGKLSTYNVAHFMQSVMSTIPANVKVQSITSNDSKHVKMKIVSTTYNELGYFVSKLKLEGTLNNIKIDKVLHGSEIQIEIGGDLP